MNVSVLSRLARSVFLSLVVFAVAASSGCGSDTPVLAPEPGADADGHIAPTAATAALQARVGSELPFDADPDQEDARRGLIASEPEILIKASDGRTLWSTADYDFIQGDAPASVNPSLWRQELLSNIHGLFKLADGVYQVRGYDLANMMLIEGKSGWIVVDPLTCEETARAALSFAMRELGERPVSAVIFTHSHVDHFGGVLGVLTAADQAARNVPVIAPAGFLEEATSENVLAGIAMGRRSEFMYGMRLARSPRGHVGSGLGKAPATGTIAILPPTHIIDRTPQEMTFDGVRFIFQYAPETEAPAELAFYLPESRVLAIAELAMHVQHNLYTLRGAKVRDALAWSAAIDEARRLFPDAEVMAPAHNWPVWGAAKVAEHLVAVRDVYKFIHDQTLRLANKGLTPREIAETIELPPALAQNWANRGYYGTVRHNSKAVYQRYFGWYDANPANLNPLPPAQEASRWVQALGGTEAALTRARQAYDADDLRWAATLLNQIVFAEPDNDDARGLLAATYDQLGYRAEAGPWRDVYLSAARELRHGQAEPVVDIARAAGMIRHMETGRFFDMMSVNLNGLAAADSDFHANFVFTDTGETFVVAIENGVLHRWQREADPEAAVTVNLTKDLFVRLIVREAGLRELIFSDELDVDGSRLALLGFFRLVGRAEGDFAIVTP
ncbi:MAG: alkyl sulfatase BDS1-like metallo-beta-lactamase superfamily hydrolase [Candidatus Binatia bacterium]|jgi:alkyl sulfatase BDS1-like metallo-beta-lactamase superfamily hydrolase